MSLRIAEPSASEESVQYTAAAAAAAASDMQRQRRALIADRQPRLVARHACALRRRDHLVRHINGFSH